MLNKEYIDKIKELKAKTNAIILAHYYVNPEIQEIADFLGDSLALSQRAKKTDADTILFCGVHFMAETAKILNPTKKVILPDIRTGCTLADLSKVEDIEKWKNSFNNPFLISYINCSTKLKAISDVICTSSNAEKIVKSIPKDKTILFATDKNLGSYLSKKLDVKMHVWKDYCRVHNTFSEEHIKELINEHPNADIAAHPECPEHILNYAKYIGSTTGIINYINKSERKEFIILTEPGIKYQLEKNSTDKQYFFVKNECGQNNICINMKKNTIEKIIEALENLSPEITIEEELRLKALKPLELMLELS